MSPTSLNKAGPKVKSRNESRPKRANVTVNAFTHFSKSVPKRDSYTRIPHNNLTSMADKIKNKRNSSSCSSNFKQRPTKIHHDLYKFISRGSKELLEAAKDLQTVIKKPQKDKDDVKSNTSGCSEVSM